MIRAPFKLLLISLLILAGVTACRQTRQTVPQVQQFKRYPHEHLPPSAFEPLAKLKTVEYKLREGETLASVARLRYGHQNYARVIKLYNHIEDETQVATNSTLRLPDMSVILTEAGLVKVAPEEVNLILCARAKYDKIVKELWTLPRDNQSMPEGLSQDLFEAADDLQQAIDKLRAIKPEVGAAPKYTIGQLEQCMVGMRGLTEQIDTNGYDIDIVQQRFALALSYAIMWSRDGFR
ncbi:MAG TPA: hypothetical protein VFI24_12470 [Pyrinomonadaceae bacterium]|nr:hypothetical protein [Pyrinomonadaceae bacterium]